MPTIGVITLELRFEDSHSLKNKRHFVKGLKDRLRKKFNVSVAEIDYQELWQRALIAAATVATDRVGAERTLRAVEKDAALTLGPYLVDATLEWLD